MKRKGFVKVVCCLYICAHFGDTRSVNLELWETFLHEVIFLVMNVCLHVYLFYCLESSYIIDHPKSVRLCGSLSRLLLH